jgi:hypothetical protein
VRALQATGQNKAQGTQAGCLPSPDRPEAEDIRGGTGGEGSSEQSPPSTSRTRRSNYAARVAGANIPAWLIHKINSHPNAGSEAWAMPADIVAGRRRVRTRESNKRRKAMSAMGHTLIIPSPSERPDNRGQRTRRKAAEACIAALDTSNKSQYWRNVEVVIPAECTPPRKRRAQSAPQEGAQQQKGEGNLPCRRKRTAKVREGGLPPTDCKDTSEVQGRGTLPAEQRVRPQGKGEGPPPPPDVSSMSIRGSGPQPGEG